MKIVDKSTISDVEDVERVYRETFILTSLKHQNIIKLYEVMALSFHFLLFLFLQTAQEYFVKSRLSTQLMLSVWPLNTLMVEI